ncbi:hypothetical protein [Paenibacillus sp. PAMC 26794]|nr:hypothetical protein [Paenibacillus sp. PAMC 26794]
MQRKPNAAFKNSAQPMVIFICPQVAMLYWKAKAIVWQLLRIFGVTL